MLAWTDRSLHVGADWYVLRMFEIAGIVLGSSVIAGVVAQVFHWFRPSRVSDRVSAFKGELEALKEIDDGTGLGKAGYAVSRAAIEAAMVSRLVPGRDLQLAVLLLMSMSAFLFAIVVYYSVDPENTFEYAVMFAGIGVYVLCGLATIALGVVTWLAALSVRRSLADGFREYDDLEGDKALESFAALRACFRPVAEGAVEPYRFRRLYQFGLSESARTGLRRFMREIDKATPGAV